MTKLRARSNAVVALVFLAVTIVGVVGALMVETRDLGSDPGPASYPIFVLGLMAICSLLLFFEKEPAADTETDTNVRFPRMVLFVAIALVAYIALLEPLGYILATMIFILAALLIAKERRWPILAGYSLLAPFAIYFVFSEALGVVLPSGIVEGLL